MNAIVAADTNWAIGKNNQLLMYNAYDMTFFKKMTIGKTIIVGRKTLESFPGGIPLIDRHHIVLTKNRDYQVKGCTLVHDINETLAALRLYPPENLFVIGGESIYEQLLPYCRTVYVTKIHSAFDADTYFPNLDVMKEWQIRYQGPLHDCEYEGILYPFQWVVYERILGRQDYDSR